MFQWCPTIFTTRTGYRLVWTMDTIRKQVNKWMVSWKCVHTLSECWPCERALTLKLLRRHHIKSAYPAMIIYINMSRHLKLSCWNCSMCRWHKKSGFIVCCGPGYYCSSWFVYGRHGHFALPDHDLIGVFGRLHLSNPFTCVKCEREYINGIHHETSLWCLQVH